MSGAMMRINWRYILSETVKGVSRACYMILGVLITSGYIESISKQTAGPVPVIFSSVWLLGMIFTAVSLAWAESEKHYQFKNKQYEAERNEN